MTQIQYSVPDVSCQHCVDAIGAEVGRVEGVSGVDVDLEAKMVTVRGHELDDAALREAIDEAGYAIA